jgi:hypothetical protein
VKQALFVALFELFEAFAQGDKLRIVLVLAQAGDELDLDFLGFLVRVLGIKQPSRTSASITRVSRSSRTVSRCTFSCTSSMVLAPRACQSSLPLPLGGFTDS